MEDDVCVRCYLSQTCKPQAATIHRETLKIISTVPGYVVISVFPTKRVLKWI